MTTRQGKGIEKESINILSDASRVEFRAVMSFLLNN